MQRAKLIQFAQGHFSLYFPMHSSGPRSFLEWLGTKQPKISGRITFKIRTQADKEEVLYDQFVIAFDNILKKDAEDCQKYIQMHL